jgi:hypothetical protein
MNKIYKMERLKRKMKQVERQRSYAWAMFYRAREEEHDSMVRLIQMYKEKTRSSKLYASVRSHPGTPRSDLPKHDVWV